MTKKYGEAWFESQHNQYSNHNEQLSSKEKVTAKVIDCDNVQLEQVHNFKYLRRH